MIVLEFEGDDERFSLNSMYRELLARGFMVGFKPAANILRFYPPLTIAEQDIARLLKNLDHVLCA
jgi:acetylornithine aminotransferase